MLNRSVTAVIISVCLLCFGIIPFQGNVHAAENGTVMEPTEEDGSVMEATAEMIPMMEVAEDDSFTAAGVKYKTLSKSRYQKLICGSFTKKRVGRVLAETTLMGIDQGMDDLSREFIKNQMGDLTQSGYSTSIFTAVSKEWKYAQSGLLYKTPITEINRYRAFWDLPKYEKNTEYAEIAGTREYTDDKYLYFYMGYGDHLKPDITISSAKYNSQKLKVKYQLKWYGYDEIVHNSTYVAYFKVKKNGKFALSNIKKVSKTRQQINRGIIKDQYYLFANKGKFLKAKLNKTDKKRLIKRIMKNKGWSEKKARKKVNKYVKKLQGGGLCGGFATSVMLNYKKDINVKKDLGFPINQAATTSSKNYKKNLNRLVSYCTYWQIVTNHLTTCHEKVRYKSQNKKIIEKFKNGSATIALYDVPLYNNNTGGQHIILLCGVKQETMNYTDLYVYDPNYPEQEIYLRIDNDGNATEMIKNPLFGQPGKKEWIEYTVKGLPNGYMEEHSYSEIRKYR